MAHRLAWLYMTGEWPRQEIDHIDGDRANNKWLNLRDVDHATNMQNRRVAQSNNVGGFLGVSRRAESIHIAYVGTKYIGSFRTPEEAHAAYVQRKRAAHDGCTI